MDYSKHIQKAEEAARRKNWDFAIELYQQLLEISPDVGEARAGLRRALLKRHEAGRGGGLLSKLKGAAPLATAKALSKAGRHDAAAKAWEGYLATNPVDVEANLALGEALEAGGHVASALAVYEFVTELAPKNPEGLKRAGAMMAATGEPARALEYYERALAADPRDRDAMKARKDLAAEVALKQGRFESVSHSREQIVDREEARGLERDRRLQLTEEELLAERERLEGALAGDSSSVERMLELASVHERLKDPGAALDLVQRALTYRRGDPELEERAERLTLQALKRALARAGKLGDSAEADRIEAEIRRVEGAGLRRAVQHRPGDARARLSLGSYLLGAGDADGALGELQKALADPRLAPEAHFQMGRAFQIKGFLDLARKQYQEALGEPRTLDDRGREVLYNLGLIYEAEGDLTQARGCYSRIYETDISFRDVAQKMERLRD